MLVKAFGSAVYGVDAITITVEVNVMKGKNYFIVGLPDNAIKESLQRIESALKTNGFLMPRIKLLVNLARQISGSQVQLLTCPLRSESLRVAAR